MPTLEDHLKHPEVSIEGHIAARSSALAASLEGKTAIYLDTRFWVILREVREGVRTGPGDRKLVYHIERLVESGRAFCPIAEPTFTELMKQGSLDQRVQTARAVDDLSGGVSLLPDTDRMLAEAEHLLLAKLLHRASPRPVPWTGLGFVLGSLYPVDTVFSGADECAVQKAVYDRLWEKRLADIVAMLDSDAWSRPDERAVEADRINAANAAHRADMVSFDKVLEQEFQGVAQSCVEHLPQLSATLAPFEADMPLEPWKMWTVALREMLKVEDNARALPTAHVHAVIHALFRWEYRDKKLSPNDLVDFRHAAAALGHCDALLTDGALCRTLCHRRLSLQRVHRRFVTSDVDDAIEFLRAQRYR
jgi:hypothetical protein